MAEQIIDGWGTGSPLKVNSDGSINVSTGGGGVGSVYVVGTVFTEGNPLPVSVNEIGTIFEVTQSNNFVWNGEDWVEEPLTRTVNIIAGSVQTYNPVGIGSVLITNLSVGSEVYIKAGSVQTYNPVGIGSIWFGGGIGSVTITNSLPSIGSYTTQMISGLASSVGISGAVNQGTNPWIVLGSFAQTNIGSVTITNSLPSIGSYSIQNISGTVTVDNRVAGSIVNMPIVGISGTVIGVSGIVNQGTNPWVVTGSVISYGVGSVQVVSNTGSHPVWIVAGSIQPYNPIGVGSSLLVSTAGSHPVWIVAGSVQSYNPVGIGSVLPISSTGSHPINILGYANTEIIRRTIGSPGVHVAFAANRQACSLENMGSSIIFWTFGSIVLSNANAGSIAVLNPGDFRAFDVSGATFTMQGSGLTTPTIQIIGVS